MLLDMLDHVVVRRHGQWGRQCDPWVLAMSLNYLGCTSLGSGEEVGSCVAISPQK